MEGGTKQKVDKVEIFVSVIRGPNLCDFGRRAIIEGLGKEKERPLGIIVYFSTAAKKLMVTMTKILKQREI